MKGGEISSLYRSYSPRMARYSTDGNGRDLYINYNNGGFWKKGVKVYTGSQGGSHVSERYNFKPLMKHVAPFKYYSDGSGRDSYVILESGGLKHDQRSLNEYHLKDFLRTPESCIFKFHSNINNRGTQAKTFYVSKEQFEINKKIKNIERGLINRLYHKEKHKFTFIKKENPKNHLPNIETDIKSKLTDTNFFKSSFDKINNYEINKKEFRKTFNNFLHTNEK